jgi:hypothetical protein
MGKTAIAWMVGLAQLASGWEVIACDIPEQIFERHDNSIRQVFIADDAFGRTEYDVSRGRRWEGDLDRILRLIDAKHWLIWTSRKHILERALRSLDLQGRAVNFPKPAEVLVEASQLSIEEKALILYRHARAHKLERKAKDVVKTYAKAIIDEATFTPERIRRFVQETLPGLPPLAKTTDSLLDLQSAVQRKKLILDSIRYPTTRMRRSFQGLPPSDKWLLISLLEAGSRCTTECLCSLYQLHCPVEFRAPVEAMIEDLTESFIIVAEERYWVFGGKALEERTRPVIDWIHPSYRDVVIEELSAATPLRERFLHTMTLPGLKLAISDSGGTTGQRYIPLMVDTNDWEILAKRSIGIAVSSEPAVAIDVLDALRSAYEAGGDESVRATLAGICRGVCCACTERWDQYGVVLTFKQIRAFTAATLLCSSLPRIPRLDESLEAATRALEQKANSDDYFVCDDEVLPDWVGMIAAIKESEPRVLSRHSFPFAPRYQELVKIVNSRLDDETRGNELGLTARDEMESHAASLRILAGSLAYLAKLAGDQEVATASTRTAATLDQRAEKWEGRAAECQDSEHEKESYELKRYQGFDVAGLFADL